MTGQIRRSEPRHVLLGVCGSIAACSAPETILMMQQAWDVELRVMLTHTAATLVAPRALAALTGSAPLVDRDMTTGIPHFDAADWADLLLIMPATANMLAKSAHGIADDLVSTAILAASVPVIFVPAMNEAMWHKPAVQRNVTQLQVDGYSVVSPEPALSLRTRTVSGYGVPPIAGLLDWIDAFLAEQSQSATQ